jgi:hypothetical protein
MKINITLTDNLVEQILSEHFKRKLGEDVEISFVRESAKPVDAYSEWYTVPDSHKAPNCPIELQPEQQIDVILKNGKKNRYFISDVKRSWIQECHPLDNPTISHHQSKR